MRTMLKLLAGGFLVAGLAVLPGLPRARPAAPVPEPAVGQAWVDHAGNVREVTGLTGDGVWWKRPGGKSRVSTWRNWRAWERREGARP